MNLEAVKKMFQDYYGIYTGNTLIVTTKPQFDYNGGTISSSFTITNINMPDYESLVLELIPSKTKYYDLDFEKYNNNAWVVTITYPIDEAVIYSKKMQNYMSSDYDNLPF